MQVLSTSVLDSLLGTMFLLGDDDDGTEALSDDDSLASFGGAGFGKKNLRIFVAQIEIVYASIGVFRALWCSTTMQMNN